MKHVRAAFSRLAYIIFAVAAGIAVSAVFLSGCTSGKVPGGGPGEGEPDEPQKTAVYELDPLNEKNTSYWTSLPYVKEEAREQGYAGSEACQHLTFLQRAPVNKNLMFFGTDAAGICRSTDGGVTWIPRNKGLYTSGACNIAIDPRNENHVVAANASSGVTGSKYTSLVYSLDCGDNWIKSDGTRGIGYSASQYYYDILEIDPRSYDEELGYCTDVYFATPVVRDTFASAIRSDAAYAEKRGMYRSTDGGKSYAKIPGSEELTDGIIVITDGGVFVGNMNGIFRIDGDSITPIKPDMEVHSLLNVNGLFYVMTPEGIFTSTDLTTFTKITGDGFFPDRLPRNLAVSAKDPQRMMLFARKTATGIYSTRPYYSHDGGATWKIGELVSTPELFYYYTYHAGIYTFDPDDEDIIVGIIGGEVIRSTDGGKSFYYSGCGVNNVNTGAMFNFNVYDEDIVYMGAYDFGGALTTDGGKTWKNISLSKDGDGKDIMGGYAADENTLFGVYAEAWSPGDYFRDYRYVCFSHDGGKTVNIPSNMKSIIEQSKKPAAERDPAVQSLDDFAKWHVDTSISTAFESSYQSPVNRNVLFCANYRSTDNGKTWTDMQTATAGEKCLQVYTHSGGTLYGCSKQSGFILKSDDDGATWSKVNSEELPVWEIYDGGKMRPVNAPSHIADIAVDSKNGYIYAIYYRRLYRVKLDGTERVDCNATMVKNNFNTINARSVAVDPNCPEVVYVCGSGDFYMDCDSVRRSCDSGATWSTLTPSDSKASIVKDNSSLGFEGRCVRIRKDGVVWCSTQCLGVCTVTPPYTVSYV